MKNWVIRNPFLGRIYLAGRYGPASSAIHPYLEIEGWLTVPEAVALFEIGHHHLPAEHVVVVEIGSFLGKSSIVLGKSLLHKKDAKLYCIDPFDASGDPHSETLYQSLKQNQPRSLFEQFEENAKQCGV